MNYLLPSKTAFLGVLFHVAIFSLILLFKAPALPPIHANLLKELLAGKSPFLPFGSEFEAFKPHLPPNERVSFIMDFPFTPYVRDIDRFYTAQSYFTPIVLSHEPDQRAAIVYCSSTAIAQKRLEETGYQILLPLAEGKGIAVKK